MKRSPFFSAYIGCNIAIILTGLYLYLQTDQNQLRLNKNSGNFVMLGKSNKHVNQSESYKLKTEITKIFKTRPVVQECDCSAIFRGQLDNIKYLRKIDNQKHRSPKDYIKETSNCTHFIRHRGYVMDSLTETERNFPIAYGIIMYKAVEQSERLLRAIYSPQNVYCIHVDRKTNERIYKAMEAIANCFDNVFMAPQRFDVHWGEMTVLEPDLHCMAELWKRNATWKYFINLTGQEFPLKTNLELVEILKAYNGANDIEGTRNKAFHKRWLHAGDPPHGIIPTKGNMHVIASRAFVNFSIEDQRAKDFLEWCRKVEIPDEVYYSTLNHNPQLGVPGAYKGIPESFATDNNTEKPYVARYINWEGIITPCHGKIVRDVCIFGVKDLPLLANRKELFVNKLYYDFQPVAFNCLEELIFNRTRDEYMGHRKFDVQWYKNLGFVKNSVLI